MPSLREGVKLNCLQMMFSKIFYLYIHGEFDQNFGWVSELQSQHPLILNNLWYTTYIHSLYSYAIYPLQSVLYTVKNWKHRTIFLSCWVFTLRHLKYSIIYILEIDLICYRLSCDELNFQGSFCLKYDQECFTNVEKLCMIISPHYIILYYNLEWFLHWF